MIANKKYYRALQHKRFARNSQTPDASFLSHLINMQCSTLAYRRKVFCEWSDIDASSGFLGAAGTTNQWRFYSATGFGAKSMRFRLGIAEPSASGTNPRVQIAVTEVGGSTVTKTISVGAGGGFSNAPDDVTWRDAAFGVLPNQAYSVLISSLDYAATTAVLAYEAGHEVVDPTIDYYIDPGIGGIGRSVFDATRERILLGQTQIWKKNGSHIFTWPGKGDGTAVTFTSLTWTNLFDASTAVSASSAGVYLRDTGLSLEQHCRLSQPTSLDVVLAVYAASTVNGAEIRLQDGSGTLASFSSINTTAQWYTTTATIANVDTLGPKVDIQARQSFGGGTLSVYAVSLYALV